MARPTTENPFKDLWWRINHLYKIVDKNGRLIQFKLNWAQQDLWENAWHCNVILKARQLGISTYICLLFLDRCLFKPNMSAGIIAHTLDDAQHMFRRVKVAYDNLPQEIKDLRKADNDTAQMLKFSNGSSLRVGTSLRSSTFQYLHISEFGKICAKYPDKAQEIITGALNTVATGQTIFIESTAEGRDGYFYDICKRAEDQKKRKEILSPLDYKFFFFPWYKEPSYRIGNTFSIDTEMQDYLDHLKNIGITLDDQQIAWYILKKNTQQDDMRREYPSTPEESWEVSNEGLYYCKQMSCAKNEGRIGFVPHDPELPVHTAWDLGYNDATSIWFVQIYRKEIRLIEYIEGSGESLQYWLNELKKRDHYTYGKHIAPHDILVHEYTSGLTRQVSARKLGFNLLPAQKVDIIPGIDAVRNMFGQCFFDEKKCALGLKALDNYKKEWDDRHGCWRSQPLHNWASHGCFTGETLVLTRLGRLPIMLIEKDMEILTLEGWKKCNKAVVTRKNAPLVEVRLSDGMKVRCTPDHLFLTEKGWISAKNLEKDIKIQSSLIQSPHILEEVYIEYGHKRDILKKAVHICIEMFGKRRSGIFLKNVTSTIKTMISKTINCQTCNVCPILYTSNSKGQIQNQYLKIQEIKQENGINRKREGNGIEGKQYDVKHGINGREKIKNVRSARKYIQLLLGKVDMLKNTVLQNVSRLHVLDVIKLNDKEDVYCINVPDIHHFSLANGAIVHNSDAFRTLATGLHYIRQNDITTAHNPSQYLKSRFG